MLQYVYTNTCIRVRGNIKVIPNKKNQNTTHEFDCKIRVFSDVSGTDLGANAKRKALLKLH